MKLSGWKTYTTGIAAILLGALGAIPDDWTNGEVAGVLGVLMVLLRAVTTGPAVIGLHKTFSIALIPLLLAGTVGLSGCAAKSSQPGTPPTPEEIARRNEIKCNVVMSLSGSGKLAAAYTIKESTKQATKDAVAALLVGVDAARDRYCAAVLTGGTVDDQMAAFEAFNKALDELTARTLALAVTSDAP